MKAKEYLTRIRFREMLINNLIDEREKIWTDFASLSSPQYDADRVQSTKDPDRYVRVWEQADRLDQRIEKEIIILSDLKEQTRNEIMEVKDPRYCEILLRRYIQGQTLFAIANDMVYSYDTIRHLHGHALLAFADAHPEIEEL